MVRDGIFYALGLGVVATIIYKLTGSTGLASLPILLALFFLWFFRDPPRRLEKPSRRALGLPETPEPGVDDYPADARFIVSPADGKITEAEWLETPEGSRLRLSIFLNVFDVHVNRSPMTGRVSFVSYKKGLFLNAMRADSNVLNEQNTVVIENGDIVMQVKQIAGLLARRIVCNVKEGDLLQRGQRFGLIKFGSRVDILMPPDVVLLALRGTKVKGGRTVIGVQPLKTENAGIAGESSSEVAGA